MLSLLIPQVGTFNKASQNVSRDLALQRLQWGPTLIACLRFGFPSSLSQSPSPSLLSKHQFAKETTCIQSLSQALF